MASTERTISKVAETMRGAGFVGLGQEPPVRTGAWIVWEGHGRRANDEAAAALRRAGFIAFSGKDVFGVRPLQEPAGG